MTAFILVAGAHTGGWVWREVAAGLRDAGARAYEVTLSGMDGGGGGAAGPGVDLETHIEELVRLIDRVEGQDVVLVGHCYGIHPVRGAADRRSERISRIVNVDVGIPEDGDPALKLVPDRTDRERVLSLAREDSAGTLPAPAVEEWQRWGSVAGLPAEALARLTEQAAPQPLPTLTQPLRQSGAVAELPTAGVLCTANGSSIAVVEAMVGLGDPAFQALADQGVTFFELGTGHWPMLSAPRELVDVLLRAAAGRGTRCPPPGANGPRICGRSSWTSRSGPGSGRAASICICPMPTVPGLPWSSCTAGRFRPAPARHRVTGPPSSATPSTRRAWEPSA